MFNIRGPSLVRQPGDLRAAYEMFLAQSHNLAEQGHIIQRTVFHAVHISIDFFSPSRIV